jgi:hypothetical protein
MPSRPAAFTPPNRGQERDPACLTPGGRPMRRSGPCSPWGGGGPSALPGNPREAAPPKRSGDIKTYGGSG